MLAQTVTQYLRDNRRRHLAELFELLRLPSVANTEPHACRLTAEWLVQRLRRCGLQARTVSTAGQPNVLASLHVGDDLPTLLIYGHYDVQPPDPLEQWQSPPFEPVVRDGAIWARGANDDKGQLYAHIMAVEAWQQAGGGVPVNLRVLIEGQEEVGSPDMEPFLADHAEELSADAAVISDSEFFAENLPSITCSLRGLAYVEVTFLGPSADIHSGLHGGAVTNPINALARLLAGMHDNAGRVTLPGFYDDVLPLTEAERKGWEALPFDPGEYARGLGVEALGGGEAGFSVLERRWARPTLDANGIVGGYTGAGSKTIIPAEASVKISMRLVPDQDPVRIVEGFRQHVAEHTPPGIRAEVKLNAGARPVMIRPESPAMEAGKAALAEAFGPAPALVRCGASVPITELFQRLLGLDAVLMGFGLPGDNLHSPNEHYNLEQFYRGAIASAAMMGNVSRMPR
jgi:acetylornithine deacetylase/succinyl-diaminopimelate desuccinylase-like protein